MNVQAFTGHQHQPYLGLVLLCFGVFMLVMAIAGKKKDGEPPRPDVRFRGVRLGRRPAAAPFEVECRLVVCRAAALTLPLAF